MKVKVSNRIANVQEYYFSRKLKEIAQLRKEGKPIINLGIGSPDQPPHPEVLQTMERETHKAENHGYQSYYGIPELRQAFSDFYKNNFRVTIDPDTEVLPLIGSKEGIMHISMAFLDPGDEVLVPDPGYPTYQSATLLAGGRNRLYVLKPEDGWLPDLEKLSTEDLSNVRLMWVNYPHMPTGARANALIWKKLVEFGRQHDIIICHDNPYNFILNPDPQTIFSIPHAQEVCLELNSLSKSHNMAGWRVGAIIGASKYLNEIIKFKSNMDSGMFRPTQIAAAKALSLGQDWYDSLNEMYQQRKDIAYRIMDDLECRYDSEQAGLFVWGEVSDRYEDGYALSDVLLYETNVFITPGGIFGEAGRKYIRISICMDAEVLRAARERIHQLTHHNKAMS